MKLTRTTSNGKNDKSTKKATFSSRIFVRAARKLENLRSEKNSRSKHRGPASSLTRPELLQFVRAFCRFACGANSDLADRGITTTKACRCFGKDREFACRTRLYVSLVSQRRSSSCARPPPKHLEVSWAVSIWTGRFVCSAEETDGRALGRS